MTTDDPGFCSKRRDFLHAAAAGAALAAAGYVPSAFGQETTIKLGHVGEPGSLFQKSADEFAKRARRRSSPTARASWAATRR
jgi:TRAP-type C4-dicarboxylate transport system substrate-binding protein